MTIALIYGPTNWNGHRLTVILITTLQWLSATLDWWLHINNSDNNNIINNNKNSNNSNKRNGDTFNCTPSNSVALSHWGLGLCFDYFFLYFILFFMASFGATIWMSLVSAWPRRQLTELRAAHNSMTDRRKERQTNHASPRHSLYSVKKSISNIKYCYITHKLAHTLAIELVSEFWNKCGTSYIKYYDNSLRQLTIVIEILII